MDFDVLNFSKRFTWLISDNDPLFQPIQYLPGYAVVNPLLNALINRRLPHGDDKRHSLQIFGMTQKGVLISTPDLALLVPEQANVETTDEAILSGIGSFLAGLKYASKQANLATDKHLYAIERCSVPSLPQLVFPRQSDGKALVRSYFLDTAICWDHVLYASSLEQGYVPPIYVDLLLDAIEAIMDKDERKAILYAAIAIETVASTKLDEAYEDMLATRSADSMFRVISLPQAGGKTVTKDPVYESIASRNDFASLLHERPLYLFGRSLMVEDESAYQLARRLYRTRNKIAHQGGSAATDLINDPVVALDCALRIFAWFGEHSNYPIPRWFGPSSAGDFITIEAVGRK